MFTGIIKVLGRVRENRGKRLWIKGALGRLPRGSSVAVNGVCLTVVGCAKEALEFDVSPETLRLTGLGALRPGDPVNLERSMRGSDMLGGHLISGHVDATAEVLEREEQGEGFVRLRIGLPASLRPLTAYKGSISIDGASLTVTRTARNWFETVLIPETLRLTTLGVRRPGDRVNLEADLMARYVVNALRILKKRGGRPRDNLRKCRLRGLGGGR